MILDDIWAWWRADHGTGVGWTANQADHGLVVNGNHVSATGLFVEHYQRTEVIWNGADGRVIFFQNEMPYDVPSQAAWMSNKRTLGYPAISVEGSARRFEGYDLGSYSFFNQGINIDSAQAFEVARPKDVSLHDLLTVFLNGSGGIDSVVNGVGPASNATTAGKAQNVASFP